ncbi:hypothetical protein SAMN05444422_101629 [Halobiforma haloterrestris]|uniref:Uncharacterized protein n=1 Tax=Natronobacterium haloterrestre TaxID=148448 RepID=A0A1I1DGG5_NATHA|nr:hypothetical protein [Halobiforma haloterrestris]SFB74069.1 hypothetical protein SAMN05444422_101629 [Halobiforma haloterrestris]
MTVRLLGPSVPTLERIMTYDRSKYPATMDRETVQSVGKLLLATLSAILLLSLLSVLPGVGRVIPGTPVTFVAVVGAVVTVAIVGLLLWLAPALASLVRSTADGPPSVVDDVASIVQLFVVLVAVLVAHRGLEPAIAPLLGRLAWTYDVLFLVLALGPLAILAARIYVSLDPIAELLAERVVADADARDTETGRVAGEPSRKTDADDETTHTGSE